MVKKYLSHNILKQYDMALVKQKIYEVFDLIDYLDSIIYDFEYPTITSNGVVRYEQFLPNISNSKLEDFVLEKLCKELRGNDIGQKRLMSKITLALKKLNVLELKVFKLSYYDQMTIDDIVDDTNYCERKVKDLKKSASVKFLMALNIDNMCYRGGDKLKVGSYFREQTRETI